MSDDVLREIREHLARIEQLSAHYVDQVQQNLSDQETRQLEESLAQLTQQDRLERADLYFNRAEQLFFEGDLHKARAEYRKVVLADRDHLQAIYSLANLSSLARDFDEAILGYKQCLRINPDFGFAHQKILLQYRSMYGSHSSGKEMLQRVLHRLEDKLSDKKHHSCDAYALAIGHLLLPTGAEASQRIAASRRVLDDELKKDSLNPFLWWGIKYTLLLPLAGEPSKKNFKEAVKACESAIATDKFKDSGYFELGETFEIQAGLESSKKLLSKASGAYEKALEFNPDNVDALLRLASIKESQYLYFEAINLLQRAASLDPFHTYCLAKLGKLYLQTRFFEKAQDTFLRLLEISGYVGSNNYFNILSSAEQDDPKLLEIRLELARTFEASKKIEEALSQYKLILREKPDSIIAGTKYIDLIFRKFKNQDNAEQEFEGFIKQFKEASFFDPGNAVLAYLLGYAYLRFHESFSYREEILARAIQQFEKASRTRNDLKEAYFSLKDLYLQTSYREQNTDALVRAQKLTQAILEILPAEALCHQIGRAHV